MKLLEYLWYAFRLSFQFGGPASVGAVMQMEGYTDDEIADEEDFHAKELVKKWVRLLKEAPPSHIAPEGAEFIRTLLGGALVPSRRELHDLRTGLAKHNGSRWLNFKVEAISWHIERYSLDPEYEPGKVTSS
jgi:hypothetical protein